MHQNSPALAPQWNFDSPVEKVIQAYVKGFVKPVQDAIDRANEPRRILIEAVNSDPRYATAVMEVEKKEYLLLQIDSLGFFVIDGNRINRCHAWGSKYGKMLRALMVTPDRIVRYKDLAEITGTSDRRETFRTLKNQLRFCGYKMVYETIRGVGIRLFGIVAI